jgi:hypothetical protein
MSVDSTDEAALSFQQKTGAVKILVPRELSEAAKQVVLGNATAGPD